MVVEVIRPPHRCLLACSVPFLYVSRTAISAWAAGGGGDNSDSIKGSSTTNNSNLHKEPKKKKKKSELSSKSKSKKLRAPSKSIKSSKGKGKGSPKGSKKITIASSKESSSNNTTTVTSAPTAGGSSKKSKGDPSKKDSLPVPIGNATATPTFVPTSTNDNSTETETDAPVAEDTGAPSVAPVGIKSEAPDAAVEETDAPIGSDGTGAPSAAPVKNETDAPVSDSAGEVISLGNIRPEGITTGEGSNVYVTNILYGGVRKVDVMTNETTEIVPNVGYFERVVLGLQYDDGYLFVCGSGPAFGANESIVYVFDAENGEEVAACTSIDTPGQLWNDITILDGTGYITDSRLSVLYTLDVEAAKDGECVVGTIDLPEQFFLSVDSANMANGTSTQLRPTVP